MRVRAVRSGAKKVTMRAQRGKTFLQGAGMQMGVLGNCTSGGGGDKMLGGPRATLPLCERAAFSFSLRPSTKKR